MSAFSSICILVSPHDVVPSAHGLEWSIFDKARCRSSATVFSLGKAMTILITNGYHPNSNDTVYTPKLASCESDRALLSDIDVSHDWSVIELMSIFIATVNQKLDIISRAQAKERSFGCWIDSSILAWNKAVVIKLFRYRVSKDRHQFHHWFVIREIDIEQRCLSWFIRGEREMSLIDYLSGKISCNWWYISSIAIGY